MTLKEGRGRGSVRRLSVTDPRSYLNCVESANRTVRERCTIRLRLPAILCRLIHQSRPLAVHPCLTPDYCVRLFPRPYLRFVSFLPVLACEQSFQPFKLFELIRPFGSRFASTKFPITDHDRRLEVAEHSSAESLQLNDSGQPAMNSAH